MNFDQFARELQDIGEQLPIDIEQAILEAANIVIEEVKANAPYKDGALRRSIRARIIDGDFLGISMEEYGWYLNYGVKGIRNQTQQFGVPEPVASQLGVSPGHIFQFGTGNSARNNPPKYWGIHYPGIKGRRWVDIENVINRVTEIVNQNLEL